MTDVLDLNLYMLSL